MITMEILGKIRRMYLRDKLSLHEITKRTGLSRNTVRRWLRKDAGVTAAPAYRRDAGPGKLTAFHEAITQALTAEAHRLKQNRRTGKAIFMEIKKEGYEGCYSQLSAFIRAWRNREGKAPHAFVLLKFELGEAFQFDWSDLPRLTNSMRGWASVAARCGVSCATLRITNSAWPRCWNRNGSR